MKALCINIDSDKESWALSQEQFAKMGMEVERFPAIVEDNRPLAFNKSVHAALSLMPEGGWLFEDDIMFEGDPDEIRFALRRIPVDFLTFSLGLNIIGMSTTEWKMPDFHGRGVVKVWNAWQTHANYYSKEAVEYILKNFPYVTDEYKTEGCQIYDEWLRVNVFSQGRSFLLNPMIAYQRPRHSAIWNCPSDYSGAHVQGNEWLKKNIG